MPTHVRRRARLPVSAVALALLLGLAAAIPRAASAQTLPPPQHVLSLHATATVEVPRDVLAITLSTSRDGSEAASVQSALKQALEAALAEARKVARPGQVDVRAGNFSLFPRNAPRGGGISGWQGSTELVIEGRDMPAIAALAGRITSMSIARVAYGLSREAREKVESEVTAQAVARFRAKAAETARMFGFDGYAIREVSVSADAPGPSPVMMRRMAASAADEALPVEPGQGSVTATVNGSVQMR